MYYMREEKERSAAVSTQDKLERVLRDIHVLISRSEPYDKTGSRIIVEKQKMFEQLSLLNNCIYEMMDDYEITQQSRDKADREAKKRGDKIIWNASRNAEDVYAASVLYTDEALTRAQDIVKEAAGSIHELLEKTENEMKLRRDIIRENQSELKSQLQDMVDTEKYLKIIEDRNKEIEKEKREKEEGKDAYTLEKQREKARYEDRKTEIKVNPEYFEKIGKALEQEAELESADLTDPLPKENEKPKITVDLDAEYFKWKKNGDKKK